MYSNLISAFSCLFHPDGVYPLPGSLSSVVLCNSGDTVILNCPGDFVVNEKELKCVAKTQKTRGKVRFTIV